jgi:hypothetical protein
VDDSIAYLFKDQILTIRKGDDVIWDGRVVNDV